jgi:hypothetical protein
MPTFTSCLFKGPGSTASGLLGLLILLSGADTAAQPVARQILVEHFTNTLCSVCAARNPGFYANLRQQPNTLHLAYHPSSPYRACLFSTQNPGENDARANLYGVYGATPRLVINGTALAATDDYASASIFAPYQQQTTPFAVSVVLQPHGADSLTVTARLATRASHGYPTARLFLALAQDTVQYAAPNGEPRHYDVFRKSFTGVNALVVAPAAVGGVVTVVKTIYRNPAWAAGHLYALAILQDNANAVLQAAASPRLGSVATAAEPAAAEPVGIYPNPVGRTLFVQLPSGTKVLRAEVVNALGQVAALQPGNADGSQLEAGALAAGAYVLRLSTSTGALSRMKFIKLP